MADREAALKRLLKQLISQEDAKVIVPANHPASGFWFGGGNAVEYNGSLYLVGRYRDVGDSRFGLAKGQRGLSLAIFKSDDGGCTYERIRLWTKQELSACGCGTVLSIEGSSLHYNSSRSVWELFVSSEKERAYPEDVDDYQKPGTGVWSIDLMSGPSIEDLDPTASFERVLECHEPSYLHVKDPLVYTETADGETRTVIVYCTHPFCWSSANTGRAHRKEGESSFQIVTQQMTVRGPNWDVAACRITGRLVVPAVGIFAGQPQVTVFFYDGAECVRPLDESNVAVKRPRGYSCEELGGAFVQWAPDAPLSRLSEIRPLFVSPWGTGCSRYVEALETCDSGRAGLLATWQQSQADRSQPLVGHFLSMEDVTRLLTV